MRTSTKVTIVDRSRQANKTEANRREPAKYITYKPHWGTFEHSSGRQREGDTRRHTMQVYILKQRIKYYFTAMYKTFWHGGRASNTHNAAGIILATQQHIIRKTRGINNTLSDVFKHAESKLLVQPTKKSLRLTFLLPESPTEQYSSCLLSTCCACLSTSGHLIAPSCLTLTPNPRPMYHDNDHDRLSRAPFSLVHLNKPWSLNKRFAKRLPSTAYQSIVQGKFEFWFSFLLRWISAMLLFSTSNISIFPRALWPYNIAEQPVIQCRLNFSSKYSSHLMEHCQTQPSSFQNSVVIVFIQNRYLCLCFLYLILRVPNSQRYVL